MSLVFPSGSKTENTYFQEQYYPPLSSSCRIGRTFKCQKLFSSSDSSILVPSSNPSKHIQNRSAYSVKISASTQINNYKHFIYRSGEKKKSKLKLSDFAILWVILPIQAFVVAVVYNSSKTRVLHKIRWRNVLIYKAAL